MKPSAETLFGPTGTPRVVVVGAGFGGIAAGVKLRDAGIETFTIYESSDGIGGTWWDNTYPGAEVDVGSHLYCFSFRAHDWSRTHARQPELQRLILPKVARGELICAFALTEPEAGSDVAGIQTIAEPLPEMIHRLLPASSHA